MPHVLVLTLIPPSENDNQKRELQANLSDKYRWKNPQYKTGTHKATNYQKVCTVKSSGIHPRNERVVQHPQISKCNMQNQQS